MHSVQIKDNQPKTSTCVDCCGTDGHHFNKLSSSLSPSGAAARNASFQAQEESQLLDKDHPCDSYIPEEMERSKEETTPLRKTTFARKFENCGTEWRKIVSSFLALSIPIIFATVHMYVFYRLWGHLKIPVDKRRCTCSCWDTIFKGTYESGVANYKHVYFNTDGNTLRMWIITVVWVLYLYEAFKRLFLLLLSKKLRWTMGILLLSSIHSHQYSWWALWNYLNDEFYSMWYHQIFFSVTELISSVLVLNYLDVRRSIKPIPMLIVWTIAVFHISCAGWDQFVFTVIQGKGRLHQVLRDLLFMGNDIMNILVSLYELRQYSIRKGVSLEGVFLHRRHIMIVVSLTLTMLFAVCVFP